jgi:adenylate cyclase
MATNEMNESSPSENDRPATFIFADLAGFTSLTEAHGDTQAAQLIRRFEQEVHPLLARHGASEVKCIGDALMLHCPDAADAVRLAVEIVFDLGDRPRFPAVRAGMNTGAAVSDRGDWFGGAVNLAARVSGEARGGEVLLTQMTYEASGSIGGIEFIKHGERRFKGLAQPAVIYAAVRSEPTSSARPVDPVCRMLVDEPEAAGVLTYLGKDHYFCSLACASRFAADPAAFV